MYAMYTYYIHFYVKKMLHLSAHVLKVRQHTVRQCYVKKIARSWCHNKNCKRMNVKVYMWLTSFTYDVCHVQRAHIRTSYYARDMPTGKERTCHRIRRHMHKNISSLKNDPYAINFYETYNCSFLFIYEYSLILIIERTII